MPRNARAKDHGRDSRIIGSQRGKPMNERHRQGQEFPEKRRHMPRLELHDLDQHQIEEVGVPP